MTDETLFATALDHPDPGARAAFLDSACPDPQQRARVEALLAAHTDASGFLSRPALDSSGTDMPTQAFAADAAEPDVGETVTRASGDARAVAASDALAFLQPSQRPGSLGRIAHYEVQAVLGSGGFGTVFKAFDERLHRVVAVKVLAPQLAASGAARARFLREGRSGAAVRDEHVVNVYAVSDDAEPIPYMVMEFVSGQTLQQKLDKVGPLPPKEVLRIGAQIARGLSAAHQTGLIHRDIKPANILLENGVERVKITDFGLARAADDASISQSGVVAGTPMYMSPEQARGDQLDSRSDLFSLGSVLYALCAGHPPFRAETTLGVLKRVIEDDPRPVREVNSEIPQWLADVVNRLLAKNPADRFQTAAEAADLLAGYLAEFQQRGTVTAAAGVAPRRKRPRWVWPVALGAVNGLIIAVLLARPWAWGEPRSGKKELGPPTPAPVATSDDGFVPLFNGKDLSGWTQKYGAPNWRVENGILTASGPLAKDFEYSFLASERSDYTDFHLRAEVRLRTPQSDSGILLRWRTGASGWWYVEANVARRPDKPREQLGSILVQSGSSQRMEWTTAPDGLADPLQWVTLEVIAGGDRVQTRVNGKPAAEVRAAEPRSGAIMLQQAGAQTVVEFRKIEIKELPSAPLAAVAPFDAAKAKELQSAWADHLGVPVETTNAVGMKLRLIPPGEFVMGAAPEVVEAAEATKPQHKVWLSAAYRMAATEVTYGQFKAFVDATGYKTEVEADGKGAWVVGPKYVRDPRITWRNPQNGVPVGDQMPVTCVTYKDCMAFCAWLSEREGLTYRLPTEAEWEYACRSGTTTLYHFGSLPDPLKLNYNAKQPFAPRPVASYPTNAFGLHDMHGNVWERCFDGKRVYTEKEVVDPVGPKGESEPRANRGGSFQTANPVHLTSFHRFADPAAFTHSACGFRVAVVGDLKPRPKP